MIIGAWKPKTKSIEGKQIIDYYTKVDVTEIDYDSAGSIKIIYVCDDMECSCPDKKHSISLSHLKNAYIDPTYHAKNTLDLQKCTSCKSRGKNNGMYGRTHTNEVKEKLSKIAFKEYNETLKNEYGVSNCSLLDDIKNKKDQIIINFNSVSDILKKEGYDLLYMDGYNKNAMLKIKCPHDHVFYMKYINWRAGHRCRWCYYDSLRRNGIGNLKEFKLYRRLVYQHTNTNYRKYIDIINPSGKLKRGRGKYHLDHKYSIYKGYRNSILPSIIGNFVNLELITESENTSKQEKCSITLEELTRRYFKENFNESIREN